MSTAVLINKGLTLCQVLLLMAFISLQAEEIKTTPTKTDGNVDAEIMALLHEAKKLEEAGRFADARQKYSQVLKITPGDYDIRRKIVEVGLERPDAGFSYFVEHQLMAVEAQTHMLRAEQFYKKGQIQLALDELDYAEALHNRTKQALTNTDVSRLHELRVLLFRARKDNELAEREKQRLENQRRMVAVVQDNEVRERNIFEQRLARISDLVKKALYERALVLSRNLVRDYPANPAADTMFMHVVDLAHKQRQLSFDESMENLKREIRHQMHEGLIPKAWDGMPIYPEDWNTRINTREVSYYEIDIPDWKVALQNKMAERTSVNFEDQDIGDALDFLSTRLGVNIVVDPDVRASGTVVNIQARNMTIGNILSWLAQQADSQWEYYNEAIYFGPPQEQEPVTRIYDVGQLVYAAPDFPGVELVLGSGQSGASGGAGLFSEDDGFDTDGGIAPEDLIDLLQETVNPIGWEDHDDWGIRVRGSTLMITANADTHLLIREFIHGMRDANDLLVNISARWVTISDIFVEEIGLNFLNEGRLDNVVNEAIHPSRPRDPDDDVDFGINVEHVLPGSAVSTAQTILDRGLRLDFAVIDAIQMVAVFEAFQIKEKGRVLEEVSLTVHNAARANAFMARSIAYIRDYDVESGAVGGGNGQISRLDPQIGILNVGAALDIKPFVSSDRKYVSLDLRPSFTTVEFDIAVIVAIQQFNAGALGRPPSEMAFPIELPIVRSKQVRTRVMIPDRGTILAGGFGEHIEQNSYAQIPVLGNLPFIGRLFGRRAIRESRQSLYLMVTPKIIMFSELETLQ